MQCNLLYFCNVRTRLIVFNKYCQAETQKENMVKNCKMKEKQNQDINTELPADILEFDILQDSWLSLHKIWKALRKQTLTSIILTIKDKKDGISTKMHLSVVLSETPQGSICQMTQKSRNSTLRLSSDITAVSLGGKSLTLLPYSLSERGTIRLFLHQRKTKSKQSSGYLT